LEESVEKSINKKGTITKERRNDTEKQFIRAKNFARLFKEAKRIWGNEEQVQGCTRNERDGVA
jgi:hypothetical protein